MRALRYVLQDTGERPRSRNATTNSCRMGLLVVQPGHPFAAREGEERRLIPHDGFRGDVLHVAAFAEEPLELRSRTMNMLAIVALIALIAIIIALWRIRRPPPPPPVS